MFTIPRSKLSYLDVCICILASFFFFWAGLIPSGHYRLSKLQLLVLTKCLIKIMLIVFFSSKFYFFMQILSYGFPYCQIPVHHQLYSQHLCSSCMLGHSLSEGCLDPSFVQETFSGDCISPKGVKSYDEWWCCTLFDSTLGWKILELHNVVNNCIYFIITLITHAVGL